MTSLWQDKLAPIEVGLFIGFHGIDYQPKSNALNMQ